MLVVDKEDVWQRKTMSRIEENRNSKVTEIFIKETKNEPLDRRESLSKKEG